MNRFLVFDDPSEPPAGGEGAAPPPVVGGPEPGSPRPLRPPCVNHARVASLHVCTACLLPICVTCAFTFPGERYFCPACATAPRKALSGSRGKSVIWGLVLAAVGTVGVVGLPILAGLGGFSGPQDQVALGMLMMLFGLGPNAIGLALSISSWEKAGPNPPQLWAAIIWNGVVAGLMLLTMLAGVLAKVA